MELCNREECTYCGACIAACPKQCIVSKIDEFGFVYPSINKDSCINCGKCNKVCHVINSPKKSYPQKAYAAWSLDDIDRKTSTSGGASSIFCQQAVQNNGVAYGAVYDENLNVVIKGYDNHNIVNFKNSKYVHSDMTNAFSKIKENLNNKLNVIVIALPCQISALKTFLCKEYDNLITVDIICHGTPSQIYLNEHIKNIEDKAKTTVNKIRFRDDNDFKFQCFNNENERPFYIKTKNADEYLLPFFESVTYYNSCYNCNYACNSRVGDITIGDFWGLGAKTPFEHEYSGAISLVLINTDKGNEFFDAVKQNMFYEQRDVQEALDGNAQLNNPSVKSKNRDKFLSSYKKNGFDNAIDLIYHNFMKKSEKEYKKQLLICNTKNKIKRLIGR